MRRLRLAAFCLVALAPAAAGAQQPFISDDAGVSDPGTWHLEVSNQTDRLRPSARPLVWQNLFESELDLGLPHRLELSAIVPVLSLVGDGVQSASGIGDSAFGIKARFTRDPAARHAWAGSLTIELPTGDRARELGSGLVDYNLNAISQHLVRGRVHYGTEVTASWSARKSVGDSLIQAQVGANVALRRNCTLDVGGGTGWFEGSARATVQVGLSVDLNPPAPTPPRPAVAHGATRPASSPRPPAQG